jgi:serine phosphatase RsbU (regulator of sigma subunit)
VFSDEKRFSLFAHTAPAREVGGDLYDFFRLDDDRLMFFIGDVSGKGLPSGLFVAASKALIKSAALRHGGDVAAVMQEANREIARDNSESLFVTLFAGILDARSGQLEYCNAGFEPAYLLSGQRPVSQLSGESGPPLCVIDDFRYEAASYGMCPGEKLCLLTDGVVEALNSADLTYGRTRLETLLAGLRRATGPSEVGEAIHRDLSSFTAGAESADDATILILCWH